MEGDNLPIFKPSVYSQIAERLEFLELYPYFAQFTGAHSIISINLLNEALNEDSKLYFSQLIGILLDYLYYYNSPQEMKENPILEALLTNLKPIWMETWIVILKYLLEQEPSGSFVIVDEDKMILLKMLAEANPRAPSLIPLRMKLEILLFLSRKIFGLKAFLKAYSTWNKQSNEAKLKRIMENNCQIQTNALKDIIKEQRTLISFNYKGNDVQYIFNAADPEHIYTMYLLPDGNIEYQIGEIKEFLNSDIIHEEHVNFFPKIGFFFRNRKNMNLRNEIVVQLKQGICRSITCEYLREYLEDMEFGYHKKGVQKNIFWMIEDKKYLNWIEGIKIASSIEEIIELGEEFLNGVRSCYYCKIKDCYDENKIRLNEKLPMSEAPAILTRIALQESNRPSVEETTATTISEDEQQFVYMDLFQFTKVVVKNLASSYEYLSSLITSHNPYDIYAAFYFLHHQLEFILQKRNCKSILLLDIFQSSDNLLGKSRFNLRKRKNKNQVKK